LGASTFALRLDKCEGAKQESSGEKHLDVLKETMLDSRKIEQSPEEATLNL
jgi:hypothetical protein